LDVGSGANRVARVFRGPVVDSVSSCYDDFLGNALDTTRWNIRGGTATVANGICTISGGGDQTYFNDGGLSTYLKAILCDTNSVGPSPIRVTARIKMGETNNWHNFAAVWDTHDQSLELRFRNDGHVWFTGSHSGSYDEVDLGTYDTNWHTWAIEWPTGKIWRDGSLVHTSLNIPSSLYYHFRAGFGAYGTGTMQIDWVAVHNTSVSNTAKARFRIGSQTVFDHDIQAESFAQDGSSGFVDSGWIGVTPTGSQTVILDLRNAAGSQAQWPMMMYWDDLIIMLDKIITIESLQGGQKVELYNAGGGLLATMACPGPGINVTTDVSGLFNTAYGFSGYFKIYDTDGTTLLYTTPTWTIWGGDLYQWIPNQSALAVSTNYTQIYRTGSGLSPTTATVTATLTNNDTGAPVSGKTVTFTPNLGTVSPTSGTTDGNGNVSTTYTAGAASGLGGVRADFAGDATYAASQIQQLIDIYFTTVVVDATKDFQAFVEGQELVISAGHYQLAADFIPQAFTVSSPVLGAAVGGWWYIQIYRLGVAEFGGRILTRERVSGPNPMLTITGVDEKIMLQRRVANKVYLDEPKSIINDLLTRFPCGVTAGAISTYGSVISLPATYTNLFDALTQIANITGWKFRLNANRTLDFAPTFGVVQAITIQSPGTEATATRKEDWTKIDSKVYVVGSAAAASLVGVASNATTALTYGLIEESFLEKNLTAQGTVNLRAQQLLSTRTGVLETVPVDWIDSNPTGTYNVFDIVTVVDSELGLNGGYAIATLQRDLTDAYRALLNLTNRVLTIANLLQDIRKNVQDLGVL
jgi:hypothetical protein